MGVTGLRKGKHPCGAQAWGGLERRAGLHLRWRECSKADDGDGRTLGERAENR